MKIFYPYPEEFTFKKAREIQTIHTCHALARQGNQVVLGVATSPGISGEKILEYFQLPAHPNLRFIFLPRYIHFTKNFVISIQALFLKRLEEFIQRAKASKQIDVIYTRHLKVAEFCLRQKFQIPIVFESHEVFSLGHVDSPDKYQRLFQQERYVYSQVQGLVTISNHLKEYLKSHFPISCPVDRASDGVDLEQFGKLDGKNMDSNLIIYTGSLFGWKGVDTIIKAMRFLPNQKLWIVGGTSHEIDEKQRLAARWKVLDRCLFKGYLSRSDLAGPLSKAYIGVLPNHREEISERFTSPLKLFEYMAAGKVIVASDLPSIREILDGEKAYLCPPASPRSLAEAIHSVYRDAGLAQRRIQHAREAAHEYSWDCRARIVTHFLGCIVR